MYTNVLSFSGKLCGRVCDRYGVSSGECDTGQYHRNQKHQFLQGSTSEKRHEAAGEFCAWFARLSRMKMPRDPLQKRD